VVDALDDAVQMRVGVPAEIFRISNDAIAGEELLFEKNIAEN
jgi:hypothetical protein